MNDRAGDKLRGASRRDLLGGAIGVAAAAFAAPAFSAARKLSVNDKVNVAIIGAGGQGSANAAKMTGENIVATADVDYDHVRAALTDKQGNIKPDRQALKDAYDRATRYTDYRRMLVTELTRRTLPRAVRERGHSTEGGRS